MSRKSHMMFAKVANATMGMSNKSLMSNGIRIMRFHKDKVLRNVYFINEHDISTKRLTDNPTEVLPLAKDCSDLEPTDDSSNFAINSYFREYTQDLPYVLTNNPCVLNDDYGLITYGDVVATDVLLKDKIIFMGSQLNIYYHNETTNGVSKINRQQLKKMVGYDKDHHTLIILPYNLKVNYSYSEDFMRDHYPEDKRDLYVELYKKYNLEPRPNTFGVIKKLPKNNVYNLKENEIVWIQKKGPFKRQQYMLTVITERGELYHLYPNQLEGLAKEKWPDSAKYEIARKTLLTQEQLEGYPVMMTVDMLDDYCLSGYLISGKRVIIPRKLIPKLPMINSGFAQWVFVPQWFFEKRLMKDM